MQTYKNTSPTSCVYDAFKLAGFPVEERMMYGLVAGEVVELLKKNGCKILLKGEHSIVNNTPVIVLRDWKKDFAHTEYHESILTVLDYDPDSIGLIAIIPKS